MKSLWPDGDDLEVSMREVFDEAADDDQPIKDRYGLVSYGPGMIAQMDYLPSLGVMSDELLRAYDPKEYARVERLAERRAAARRRRQGRPPDWPDWLVCDLHDAPEHEVEREREILERLGLTVEEARKLLEQVPARRRE
jgi:hypothetical protein